MNDKIKELAAQAGLKIEVMIDDSGRDVECYLDTDDGVPSVATIHRFAALVIGNGITGDDLKNTSGVNE